MAAAASAETEARLVQAAKTGDSAAVRALVAQGADVNALGQDGATALHWVVRADDLATTEQLIKAGADVRAANRHGMTPLYLATSNANAAIMRVLLAAGADPDTTDITGETVLMTAARQGDMDGLRLLIERGADVNRKEPVYDHTALMWAVREGHPAAVQLLIDHKADLNAATKLSPKPAPRPPGAGGGSHGVGIVRGGIPPQGQQAPTPGGMTPLLFAARDGSLEAARMLVKAGVPVDQSAPDGITALMMAIANNQIDVAMFLLESGADPNATDWWGRTPLWTAVDTRNMDISSRTLENGVEREPVLHLIKALLEKGAQPNARVKEYPPQRRWMMPLGSLAWVDVTGQTAFFRAASSADLAVMKLLLTHGADPNIPTFNGTTPLAAAAGVNWVMAQTYSESMSDYLAAVQLCLELGNDVNAVNEMGLTALHGAANRGSNDIIEFLAKQGVDLELKDKEGRTPITWAEGVFLATHSPIAKPDTIALLEKLISESKTRASSR